MDLSLPIAFGLSAMRRRRPVKRLPRPGDVEAAVDEDALTGDEAGFFRAEPHRYVAHVVRLDARAEYEVFLRFRELSHGRTCLIISHRFSTVRMADRILVLEDGRVEEAGSHTELLSIGGRYATLFELQASGYR